MASIAIASFFNRWYRWNIKWTDNIRRDYNWWHRCVVVDVDGIEVVVSKVVEIAQISDREEIILKA